MVIDVNIKLNHWLEMVAYIEKTFRRKKPRPLLWHEWLVEIAMLIGFVALFIWLADDFEWRTAVITTVFFLTTFVSWLMREVRMKQAVKPRDDGIILGERRYEFTEKGLYIRGKYFETRVSWGMLTDIYVSKHIVALLAEDLDGIIIPVSALADKEQFLNTIRGYMAPGPSA